MLIGACLCGEWCVDVYVTYQLNVSSVSAIAWGIIYSRDIWSIVNLAVIMILRDFLLSGMVISTIIWYFQVKPHIFSGLRSHHVRFTANRLLLSPPSHSTPADSRVEWAYAFDVHTNAFFPLFLTLYLAQLFLLPIVLKDNWVCLWVGNTLYLAA